NRLAHASLPHDFAFDRLPDLSVAIEELSHFNLYCHRALNDQPISALEMEVQGEVDKFALALQWLEEKNEGHFKDKLFEILFDQVALGSWVDQQERERYEDAHRI